MQNRSVLLLILVCCFFGISNSAAQAPTNKQISDLQTEVKALRKDMREVKDAVTLILEIFEHSANKKMPISEVKFKSDESSKDDFVLGKESAPVTFMVFSDYQCGFCARFDSNALPKIIEQYVDTGKLKVIFRDFPLAMHPMAALAASYAACAGEQGKFLEMHEALFAEPEKLAQGDFVAISSMVSGLDSKKLSACLQSPQYLAQRSEQGFRPSREVAGDIMEGQKLGIVSTPSFFIGASKPAGSEMQGVYMRGALDFPAFKEVITQVLEQKS